MSSGRQAGLRSTRTAAEGPARASVLGRWVVIAAFALGGGCPAERDAGGGGRGGGDQRDPRAVPRAPAAARAAAAIASCAAQLDLGALLSVAPAAAGQRFVRCATLGPETGWSVALSPDGRRLAARTGAGTVRLLDTDSWREVAQLASPLGRMDAAAFVLKDFSAVERKELPFAIDRCADATEALITKGLVDAQNQFHTDPV